MSKKKGKEKQSTNKPEKAKPNFIIIGLAFAFFVIGIHQSLTVGFEYSYWIFMLSISLLLLQKYLQQKSKDENGSN